MLAEYVYLFVNSNQTGQTTSSEIRRYGRYIPDNLGDYLLLVRSTYLPGTIGS
jgi:hypothetical protein